VPAVENAIDKDAYLPSDGKSKVMQGLSIEVIDTDAEGRLIFSEMVFLPFSEKLQTQIKSLTLLP